MAARILDGKALAETIRAEVRAGAAAFLARAGRAPALDVILVGDDPASVVHTRNKEKAAVEVGIQGTLHRLPESSTTAEVLALVQRLNADPAVDGILVQLPVPAQVDTGAVLDAIDPAKDVDGLHPVNAGLLALGRPGAIVPGTPAGCLRLVDLAGVDPAGKSALVIGRSALVGRPVAALLVARHATVTIAHSRSADLASLCRGADILVSAVGKAGLVRGAWIKPGAVVIDVGTTRIPLADGKTRLAGDVAFDEARDVAGAITPVPGGVGPLTIAMLLVNVVQAAAARAVHAVHSA